MCEVLFIPVKTENLSEAVCRSFEGDSQLHRYYDRSSGASTLEGYVQDTVRKCNEFAAVLPDTQAYVISYRQETAGFVVLNKGLGILYSFGVQPKSRRREVLSALFDFIKSQMPEFVAYLHGYNTRAVKWLQSCGMKVEKQKGQTFVTLRYASNSHSDSVDRRTNR